MLCKLQKASLVNIQSQDPFPYYWSFLAGFAHYFLAGALKVHPFDTAGLPSI